MLRAARGKIPIGAAALMGVLVVAAACARSRPPALPELPIVAAPRSIDLRSSAFQDHTAFPPTFTCAGRDVSPPLSWSGAPAAVEYALIMTDPDAPGGTFVHWVLFGIPGGTTSLSEGEVPAGAVLGTNGFGRVGYDGPCPPRQEAHVYVFTLYALSNPHPSLLAQGATAVQVLRAIRPSVIATGLLHAVFSLPPE